MQVQFINNCRLVLSLAWRIFVRLGEVIHGIDAMIGKRGRFSGIVLPMATMAALVSLLSIIVYSRDYPHAVAEMAFVFGSFLLIYIVFVSLLNLVARKGWLDVNAADFCERAKTFVVCLLLVHFDVTVALALIPHFPIARLFEFYAIFVSWTMAGSYMNLSQHRNAFGIIVGIVFLLFIKLLPTVLKLCFSQLPI